MSKYNMVDFFICSIVIVAVHKYDINENKIEYQLFIPSHCCYRNFYPDNGCFIKMNYGQSGCSVSVRVCMYMNYV